MILNVIRFFTGSGGALVWNVMVYLLYVIPTFWLLNELKFLGASVSRVPMGLGGFSFLLVTGFVIFTDLMIHASTRRTKGIATYALHGAIAVAYCLILSRIFWKLFESQAPWAGQVLFALVPLSLLIHLAIVWSAGQMSGFKSSSSATS